LARKFHDPDRTATREARTRVTLRRFETPWINTGTLCNITWRNGYIESIPRNDRLVYVTAAKASVAAWRPWCSPMPCNRCSSKTKASLISLNARLAQRLQIRVSLGH
jgi:hypothetical protein